MIQPCPSYRITEIYNSNIASLKKYSKWEQRLKVIVKCNDAKSEADVYGKEEELNTMLCASYKEGCVRMLGKISRLIVFYLVVGCYFYL